MKINIYFYHFEGTTSLKKKVIHKTEQCEYDIPLTVKDVFSVIGLKTTIGNPLMRKHIAKENAVLIDSKKSRRNYFWEN